ncbi:MAG: tRNA-binding protein [Pseudoxanthomonas sp.]
MACSSGASGKHVRGGIRRGQHDSGGKGEARPAHTISWSDFEKVELCVGRILSATPFPEARQPAFVLQADFGEAIGVRKSSAQITTLYTPTELVGRLVVAVVNLPPKQIGPVMRECFVTGFHDANGNVAHGLPDRDVPRGTTLLWLLTDRENKIVVEVAGVH